MVTPEDCEEIIETHIVKGERVERLLCKDIDGTVVNSLDELNFYKKQKRIALKNCGVVNPEEIDEYIAFDGYKALEKVLKEMTQDEVIDVIKDSGLRVEVEQDSQQVRNGNLQRHLTETKNMWFVMQMKVTQVLSWIDVS